MSRVIPKEDLREVDGNNPPNECKIFHKWVTVKNTIVHEYRICSKCGKRKIDRMMAGHQPIDTHWLATGTWAKPSPPPWSPKGPTEKA